MLFCVGDDIARSRLGLRDELVRLALGFGPRLVDELLGEQERPLERVVGHLRVLGRRGTLLGRLRVLSLLGLIRTASLLQLLFDARTRSPACLTRSEARRTCSCSASASTATRSRYSSTSSMWYPRSVVRNSTVRRLSMLGLEAACEPLA